MNIEIVAFYEGDRNDEKELVNGTLHVHLIDIGIDLRGVFVSKKKDYWFFRLPSRKANDESDQEILYPIFSFRDREKTSDLMDVIKEKAKSFVEDYIKAHPETQQKEKAVLVIKSTERKPKVRMEGMEVNNVPTSLQKIEDSLSKPIASIKTKIFVDPPKRKEKSWIGEDKHER